MAKRKENESDKKTGDKFESLIDRGAAGGPGRKGEPESERDDETEEGDDDDLDDDEEE